MELIDTMLVDEVDGVRSQVAAQESITFVALGVDIHLIKVQTIMPEVASVEFDRRATADTSLISRSYPFREDVPGFSFEVNPRGRGLHGVHWLTYFSLERGAFHASKG